MAIGDNATIFFPHVFFSLSRFTTTTTLQTVLYFRASIGIKVYGPRIACTPVQVIKRAKQGLTKVIAERGEKLDAVGFEKRETPTKSLTEKKTIKLYSRR